ncbi:MAG: hypothetical protein KJO67_11155, partial [Silicimonas sp.]|nr:hypothetical protein [Silicimonas sp.]
DDGAETLHLNDLVDRINVTMKRLHVQLDLCALLSMETTLKPIHVSFEVPFHKRQNGRAKPIIIAPKDAPQHDRDLINLVADARRWSAELLERKTSTIREIEDREGLRSGSVSRILPLTWLAPEISAAILEGRQPVNLTAKSLRSLVAIPLSWKEQRRVLGFPHQ